MKSGIFISYRRSDSAAAAGRIRDRLTERFGAHRVFMDVTDIEPGEDFEAAIRDRISKAAAVIAIIGPTWSTDPKASSQLPANAKPDYVRQEIKAALQAGVRVIPVLIDDAQMPARSDLPTSLRKLATINALEIRHSKFDTDVSDLVDLLEDLQPRRSWMIPAVAIGGIAILAAVGIRFGLLGNSAGSGTDVPLDLDSWTLQFPARASVSETVRIVIQTGDSTEAAQSILREDVKLGIVGTNTQPLTATISDDGALVATYTPAHAGSDSIRGTFKGESLPNGPYVIRVDRNETNTTSNGQDAQGPPPTGSIEFGTRAPAFYYVLQSGRVIAEGEVLNVQRLTDLPAGSPLTLRLIWRLPDCSSADTLWEDQFTLTPNQERRFDDNFQCFR